MWNLKLKSYKREDTKKEQSIIDLEQRLTLVKTVAFIAGKKNPADQNFYIFFPLKESLKNDFKGETASKIQFRPT